MRIGHRAGGPLPEARGAARFPGPREAGPESTMKEGIHPNYPPARIVCACNWQELHAAFKILTIF